MKAELTPHGNCTYSVQENIISIHAIGPWNLEFFKQMHKELSAIILNDVDLYNFAILLILEGDSIATQDGLNYHQHLVSKGPTKALAINSGVSVHAAITEKVFKKVYDRAGLKNQCFNNTESAIAWLKAQLTPQ